MKLNLKELNQKIKNLRLTLQLSIAKDPTNRAHHKFLREDLNSTVELYNTEVTRLRNKTFTEEDIKDGCTLLKVVL